MISIALKTLRHRRAGFTGAFVALLFAAALVTACGMLLETGLRGSVAPERYAGTPVIVAGDQFVRETKASGKSKAKPLSERRWIPASIAEEVRRIPGVTKVVTEVTFPFAGFTAHGWESAQLTPFTLAGGRAPEAADEVVVDARNAATKIPGYRVVGVTAQALPSQDTIFFATSEARRLAGRAGLVTAIGVFPEVDVTVKGALAYTGDERGALEFLDAESARVKLISLGGALGGTSLLVAILVVVGTFALSIQQRQREIAMLRAVAATPKQIRKLIGGEALLVSVAAGLLGSAAGMLLGFWLQARFVALGAMPANLPLVVSPFPALAAVLATLAAAWTAGRVSARRIARIRPVEALGEAALPGGRLPWARLIAGVLAVALGVVLTAVLSSLSTEAASSPVTMLTALVWTIAVALLGPMIARVAAALPPAPGAGGHLASKNLRAGTKRLASVITPLTLMTAMTCTILFVQATMGHAAQNEVDAGVKADYVLGPGAAAATAREVPGVRAATEVLRTSARIGLDKFSVQAVTPEGLDQTMDLDVTAGSLAGFGTTSAALSRTAAERLNAGVGDRIELTLGDGTPAVVKVAAVYSRGLGFGDLTLPHKLVAAHVDDPRGTVLVSGGDRTALERALPAVTVRTQAEAAETGTSDPAVNYVAMGLIIAFCAIAVVNTLAMSTSARSRELALLRLVGATRRQILRMLRTETLIATAAAVAIGTGISLVTVTASSVGMTGSATPYLPPLTYLGVIAAAAALALLATAIPARLALRTHPAEALGARE
ncbi:putative ABC transport system permease protein [Nonomuraea polychroma]|uniref:Putative ABC transport system permease protein n=1 Tax=Nonomuraea polychroma TaxID=46176 RepID=A0A438MCL6_9ACTN|nr:ABC transporter permease [Nonomuraea polychroma]RVX43522.1 putative ABC transport system permease protein [Nonomuraea polychroma]